MCLNSKERREKILLDIINITFIRKELYLYEFKSVAYALDSRLTELLMPLKKLRKQTELG